MNLAKLLKIGVTTKRNDEMSAELVMLRDFRRRTLHALCLPADASIEQVEADINPSGFPDGWRGDAATMYGPTTYPMADGTYTASSPEVSRVAYVTDWYARAKGQARRDWVDAAGLAERDMRHLAATLARLGRYDVAKRRG